MTLELEAHGDHNVVLIEAISHTWPITWVRKGNNKPTPRLTKEHFEKSYVVNNNIYCKTCDLYLRTEPIEMEI